jgi:hypothetical protein
MFERSDFFVGAITAARPSHLLSGNCKWRPEFFNCYVSLLRNQSGHVIRI